MAWAFDTRIPLNDGHRIPVFGLGVFRATAGGEAKQAVKWALELGYRHVDTARIYGNEEDVGEALRESGVPREELFVTTKLWNDDHGYLEAMRACEESLKRLGLDYLDLYLIHWPVEGKRHDSWRALVELKKNGLCRSIGVSNYTERHLTELLERSDVVPAVNQVEFHPFLAQPSLRRFCREKGIVFESYSPLTKGKRIDDPRLAAIAKKHGRTPAQILIRWVIENEVVVIPKATKRERIAENARVSDFSLDAEDRRILDGMNEDAHVAWDPTHVA